MIPLEFIVREQCLGGERLLEGSRGAKCGNYRYWVRGEMTACQCCGFYRFLIPRRRAGHERNQLILMAPAMQTRDFKTHIIELHVNVIHTENLVFAFRGKPARNWQKASACLTKSNWRLQTLM